MIRPGFDAGNVPPAPMAVDHNATSTCQVGHSSVARMSAGCDRVECALRGRPVLQLKLDLCSLMDRPYRKGSRRTCWSKFCQLDTRTGYEGTKVQYMGETIVSVPRYFNGVEGVSSAGYLLRLPPVSVPAAFVLQSRSL